MIEGRKMKIGFIGCGNIGEKLSRSLLRNGFDLVVRDLDKSAAQPLLDEGAGWAESPKQIAESCEVVITCLPSPDACREVMEASDGVIEGLSEGKVWMELSTTDEAEVRRIGALVEAIGADAVDCPVSGGCHRAETGNISIFAGCNREAFEKIFPVLSAMGKNILHTGYLGSASVLKVLTNYLASANLASLAEALTTASAAGMDLNTTYEAIRISSGNSFVHETESQVILNGSRNINFTMDLVVKDLGLFDQIANRHKVPLELSPLLLKIFEDGMKHYGAREWSSNIIRRLEDATSIKVAATGFPEEMKCQEEEFPGHEVTPTR